VSLSDGLSLALFLSLLALVSLGQRRPVAGQSVALLRALLPSWRFFEAPEGYVLLLARAVSSSTEEPFMPALPVAARGVSGWLFSARGNLRTACHDLVDALVSDLAEREATPIQQAEQLVSYRLVQNMVQWQLRAAGRSFDAYQLKLVAVHSHGAEEELLVSPVYPC